MQQRQSACPLDCPDMCGLTVTVEGDRVVEVDGDRRGPLTDGFCCGKVRKFADHMYSKERVLHPMRRAGAKGAGQWQQITWDEALDEIAARFSEIRARSGGSAILPYHYGGSNGWLTEGALTTRFFRRLRASNLDRTYCAAATSAAQGGVYGKMPGVALEDYVHAKLIVLWGVNPSSSGIHLVPVIERAREAGAKLVVVDPRATPLAKRADLHVPVRPGADLPVALAIANALFERGYADLAFLDRHAAEVGELRTRAAQWSVFAAAREAQIEVAVLDRFIEMYAAASPAVIRTGWGMERNRNGGSAIAAVLTLPAIANKFGVRGGGFTMSNGDVAWPVTPEPAIAEEPTIVRHVNMAHLGQALATLREPAIEGLFIYNCNPAATAMDQRAVVEQLAREDLFVVVHEQVWTDTAQLADLVLPATTFLEHRELARGYGHMRMYDSPAVVPAVGEARSNNEVFGALLARMDLVRPGDPMTDDELIGAILRDQPELRAQLVERGMAQPAFTNAGTNPLPFVDVFPGTPDGKIHLVPAALDIEANGLYVYKADPETPEFPLALISPSIATQISSTFGQLRTAPGVLEISAADAAARGIASGDAVRVFNRLGEVHCTAKISADVRDGVCMMNKGLWRKHTANGFTSNALIPQATADLGGQCAWNDARVQVTKR